MPIDHPVFADLVRETSSSKGASPFALEGAPAGFRSFAGAVPVGGQFYYSAVNLSRSDEAEVGVGTLLADGTISRMPLGTAADFSAGTKSISLVVASDWLTQAHAAIEAIPSGEVTAAAAGAVARTMADKLGDIVTPQDFGAKADGVTDDAPAIQAAIDSLKGSGGLVQFPKGSYRVASPISYFLANAGANATKGIHFAGAGVNATVLVWDGGEGAMFTNAMPASQTAHFQYGFSMRDMTLKGASSTGGIVPGAVGLHAEKLQNHWVVERVRFEYFGCGLAVGIHAEGGRFEACTFAYNHVGCDAYGIQADGLVWDKSWFIYNRDRALRIAAPRPTVRSCMFVALPGFSTAYASIQLGKAQILAGDVGKSAYVGASTTVTARPDAARIVGNYFEQNGTGNRAAILLDHLSSGDTSTPERLTIEGNRFALYATPAGIEVAQPWGALTSSNNSLTSNAGLKTPLFAFAAGLSDFGLSRVDEPHIARLADSKASYWRFLASSSDFARVDLLSAIPGDASGWYFQHITGGYTTINADHDGQNGVRVELNCGAGQTTTAYWRIRKDSVPAGWAYFQFEIGGAIGLPNEPIYVTLTNASTSSKIVKRMFVPVGEDFRTITFGADLPSAGVYVIDIAFHGAREMVGSYEVRNLRIKAANPTNWQLETADGRRRLANRSQQPFEMTGRVPYVDYVERGNATAGYLYGPITQTSAGASAAAGATGLTVASATGISVGDYIFAKPNVASNVSQPHRATSGTGNKVSAIAGNVLTLATGLPFAVDAGNSVIAQRVFATPARAQI